MLLNYKPEDVLILSPYNVGEFGTYAINEKIQSIHNPLLPKHHQVSYKRNGYIINFRVGDKVLNTVNWYNAMSYSEYIKIKNQNFDNDDYEEDREKYRVDIMNGAFGKVVEIVDGCVIVEFDDGTVVYDNSNIKKLILGNACSTHKSQGNQADAVISIIHSQHEKMLHRALIYVANSRAKKKLIEIGDYNVINRALEIVVTNDRNTFLKELLKG